MAFEGVAQRDFGAVADALRDFGELDFVERRREAASWMRHLARY